MFFKAIIFDLDGTLLDTLEDLGNAMNSILAKNNLPTHNIDTYRNFVGDGVEMLVTRALPCDKTNSDAIRTYTRAFRDEYDRGWNVKTKPYDGIGELLNELKLRGLKIAVLSNKPDIYTNRCVSEFLPNWKFDMVLGQQDSFPKKPDPAGAIRISKYLKITPENIIYLGDTATDMQTAIVAGMYPVGALWGFRSEKELQENGAKALVKKPQDILEILSFKTV